MYSCSYVYVYSQRPARRIGWSRTKYMRPRALALQHGALAHGGPAHADLSQRLGRFCAWIANGRQAQWWVGAVAAVRRFRWPWTALALVSLGQQYAGAAYYHGQRTRRRRRTRPRPAGESMANAAWPGRYRLYFAIWHCTAEWRQQNLHEASVDRYLGTRTTIRTGIRTRTSCCHHTRRQSLSSLSSCGTTRSDETAGGETDG